MSFVLFSVGIGVIALSLLVGVFAIIGLRAGHKGSSVKVVHKWVARFCILGLVLSMGSLIVGILTHDLF